MRLVFERTAPPRVDAGVEPLIAVCATEEQAERIKAAAAPGRYVSWEHHPVQGAAGEPADGDPVHLVLLGDADGPIGVAAFAERGPAEQRAAAENRRHPGHRTVTLPVGWRA